MNTNSLRHQGFRCRVHAPADAVALADQLASMHRELSATARRLAPTVISEPVTAPVRPAHAHVRDGCRALEQVAALPALARQVTRQVVRQADANVVAQADRVAAVAADLAEVLRAGVAGFCAEVSPDADGLHRDLGVGLGALSHLGPNETDESLILVAETLSLAARLVLVLARRHARGSRVHRAADMFPGQVARRPAQWPARWTAASTVRVVSLPLWTDLVHLRPTASIGPWAAVVLAVLVTLVARFAPSRLVVVIANLLSVITCAALPHPALVAVALANFLTGNRLYRPPGHAFRHTRQPSPGCVGFTSRPGKASGDHREHHRDHQREPLPDKRR